MEEGVPAVLHEVEREDRQLEALLNRAVTATGKIAVDGQHSVMGWSRVRDEPDIENQDAAGGVVDLADAIGQTKPGESTSRLSEVLEVGDHVNASGTLGAICGPMDSERPYDSMG
jgi:hypothetical protein